jgi:hypothetical protein
MPRTCTICQHPQRRAIDCALASGASHRELSAKYRVSEDSVTRHANGHLPRILAKAAEAAAVSHADSLLEQVQGLQDRAMGILQTAEEAGDLRMALSAIREARGCLELLAKLSGELQQEGAINLIVSPQWVQIRTVLLQALAPHGEARAAVAHALLELETGTDG